MLSYKDDTFFINNQEQFIFGGELHYFRVPKEQWKDRINKIKEAGFNLVSTYIPWIYHETIEGEIDLTGKTSKEKDLKTFIEYVEEAGMYLLVRPGPYVMAEIENAGLPNWSTFPVLVLFASSPLGFLNPAFQSFILTTSYHFLPCFIVVLTAFNYLHEAKFTPSLPSPLSL